MRLTWMIALCAGPLAGAEPMQRVERYEFQQRHMGVAVRLVFYAADEDHANAAAEKAFERIAQLDARLSDYRANSELSALSDHAGGDPVRVSDDLWRVLTAAQRVSQQTDGAFDATIGPVVQLWRAARRTGRLPPEEALRGARDAVGYQHLRLDETRRTVALTRPGMQLDFGGIAKGDAADQALAVLRQRGIESALVDMGGDVSVSGAPPGTLGWIVQLAPLDPQRSDRPSRVLLVKHVSVATSGDAFQFVEIEGRRYSHIVDPRTGVGLSQRSSVSVVAPSGILADALASAVSVLGPQAGLAVLEKKFPGTAAQVLTLDDRGQVQIAASPGLELYELRVERLREILRDLARQKPQARAAAANTLARLTVPELQRRAAGGLLAAVGDDPSPAVRVAAAQALGAFGAEAKVHVPLLERLHQTERNAAVQQAIAAALLAIRQRADSPPP